jgi:hypothetical protein
MKIIDILEDKRIPNDAEDFAEMAFNLVEKTFSDKEFDKQEMIEFLEAHRDNEIENAVFHRKFSDKTYHPNTYLAGEKRAEAYSLMLDRLRA